MATRGGKVTRDGLIENDVSGEEELPIQVTD